jgi:hypothetical protein
MQYLEERHLIPDLTEILLSGKILSKEERLIMAPL